MKKLYAVNTHIWGRDHDELVSVQSARCADCGRLLYRSTALGQREFYLLGQKAVKNSTVSEPTIFGFTREILRAQWARENRKAVDAVMIYDGYDELGNRHVYCKECGDKTITAICARCGGEFSRTRDLTGGWACEVCFGLHCAVMCSITPGEATVLVIWPEEDKDGQIHKLYKVALKAAKYGIVGGLERSPKENIKFLRWQTLLARLGLRRVK